MVKLTEVELNVLEGLGAGLQQKQIATVVKRSPAGVADSMKQLRKKLKTHTSAGAVGAAYRNGRLPRKDNA